MGIDARVIPARWRRLRSSLILVHVLPPSSDRNSAAIIGLDQRPDALGIDRRDADADDSQRRLRHAFVLGNFGPVLAAVGALPESRARSAAFEAIGRPLHSPKACVHDGGTGRVEGEIDRTHFLVDEEHLLPSRAAVGRAIDAALLVRAKEMPERRRINDVRILRMDAHASDMPAIRETDVLPRLARIHRFPHAVAVRHVAAHGLLAGADIDHARVGFAHRDGADRPAEESVGNVLPGTAAIGRPPDAPADRAEVEEERLAWHAGHCTGASAPEWPNQPIAHAAEKRRLRRRRGLLIGKRGRRKES